MNLFRIRSRRGIALIAVLQLAVLLALIAEALARVSFERVLVYHRSRDAQFSRLAATTATSELASCLQGSVFPVSGVPPAPTCDGWSLWACTVATCSSSKTLTLTGADTPRIDVAVSAEWTTQSLSVRTTVTPVPQ